METQISYVKARTARARLRGSSLVITLPRHWPRSEQEAAVSKFTRWGRKQFETLQATPLPPAAPPLSLAELTVLVERVNRETVGVRYSEVRIGQARYTRLAQVNLKTGILTFSRYAIDGLPERALRYLILHELSHLLVPNHSAAFWKIVGQHMPDYKTQRQVAQRHFMLAAQRGDVAGPAAERPAVAKLPLELQVPVPIAPVERPASKPRVRPQQMRLF